MIVQHAIVGEGPDALPPFRSSTDFPLIPKANQLKELYSDCYQALMDANEARRVLRKRMSEKKIFIARIRSEIERLERTMPDGRSRIRLHMMNLKLLNALKEVEGIADDFAGIAYEGNRAPRTNLHYFIKQIKALAQRWRTFKLQLQQELLEGGGEATRDELNG